MEKRLTATKQRAIFKMLTAAGGCSLTAKRGVGAESELKKAEMRKMMLIC